MLSVACKNDNSAYCLHFLIMPPDPYFYFISGLYISVTIWYYLMILRSIIQQANAEFLIIFPDPYFLFMQLLENLVFVKFPRFLSLLIVNGILCILIRIVSMRRF